MYVPVPIYRASNWKNDGRQVKLIYIVIAGTETRLGDRQVKMIH